MRVLAITNMYPSKQKPYSGLFVVNQLEEIKRNKKISIDFFYMKRRFTGKIGSLIKYQMFFIRFIYYCLKLKISCKNHELVHVHYFYPTIYLALFYKLFVNNQVKILVTFHGSDLYQTKKNILFTWPLKFVNALIGVSSGICLELSKYYKGKIYNIPAGINKCFQPKQASIPDYKYDFIYVGSFYPIKGFDRLVELIKTSANNFKFCIIGSGHLIDQLDTLDRKKNFHIYNDLKQTEIVSLLHKSRFLINLSREESFGLSMTEAMACGVPVIATLTDGSAEQIIDGVNGFIINNSNKPEDIINDIFNKLPAIDENKYRSLIDQAILSTQKYKLTCIGSEVVYVYENILNLHTS